MKRYLIAIAGAFMFALAPAVSGQSIPFTDPVLRRIWAIGMDSSQTYPLAQALLDSIGPRLTGTPQQAAATNWALARYAAWGIPARKEQYGTFQGWSRGYTHVDLLAPRVRTLEGTLLPWSPGTGGKDVIGEVVVPPLTTDSAGWLASVRGKYVLLRWARPSCRPLSDWEHWAAPGSLPYTPVSEKTAGGKSTKPARQIKVDIMQLEAAGAAGVLTGPLSDSWGISRIESPRTIFQAYPKLQTERLPLLMLSCEDFGLLYRLAEHGQGPQLRVNIQAEPLGDVPVHNVIAELKGTVKPAEYVMLSAHLDSWDGASGATDNGAGSVVIMEAMRILKAAYPKPKRTIMGGLWNGEEQGLYGSRGFVQAHPDVVQGLHALFNHDEGTGRIEKIAGEGFPAAKDYFTRWLGQIPDTLTRTIATRDFPGKRSNSGTDHVAFVEAGAPGFNLIGREWNYWSYTWHSNRDTFDKLSFDDLKANATLLAMLAYLASEDAVKLPRS